MCLYVCLFVCLFIVKPKWEFDYDALRSPIGFLLNDIKCVNLAKDQGRFEYFFISQKASSDHGESCIKITSFKYIKVVEVN